MKATKLVPAVFAVVLLLLIFKSFSNQYVPNYEFNDWEHGTSGYHLALKEAKGGDKPLIVYFHTSWCGWCKNLEQNYLAAVETEEFLKNIPKVEINPDKGKNEKALFNEFGLTGYPSFLVLRPKLSSKSVKISPFLSGRELSVEEFLGKIKKVIASAYES